MARPSVLRIRTYQPIGYVSDLDETIRRVCRERLRGLPGLTDLHAGRRGPDQADERVMVSVWTSREHMIDGLGPRSETEPAEAEAVDRTTDLNLEVLPIELSLSFDRDDPPRILRISIGARYGPANSRHMSRTPAPARTLMPPLAMDQTRCTWQCDPRASS